MRKDRSTSTIQVIKTEASEDRRETMVFRHLLYARSVIIAKRNETQCILGGVQATMEIYLSTYSRIQQPARHRNGDKVSVRRRSRKNKNEKEQSFVVGAQASDSGLTACFVPSREQVLMRCSLGKVRLEIQIPQQRTALHTKLLHHRLSIDIGCVLIAQRKEKSFCEVV